MLWHIYESIRTWLSGVTPAEAYFFGFIISGILSWHAAKVWYTGSLDDEDEIEEAEPLEDLGGNVVDISEARHGSR